MIAAAGRRRRRPALRPSMPKRLAPLLPLLTLPPLVAGCAAEQPAPVVFERVVVHCYRTLAEPECVAEPLPGERDRLLGVGVSGYFAVPAGSGD